MPWRGLPSPKFPGQRAPGQLAFANAADVATEQQRVRLVNARVANDARRARRQQWRGALVQHEEAERQITQIYSKQVGEARPVAVGED